MNASISAKSAHHDSISDYYGRVLTSKADLKTTACCPTSAPPTFVRSILKKIDPEIPERSYGCGSPIPTELMGRVVLDLGCGTGQVRDPPSACSCQRTDR